MSIALNEPQLGLNGHTEPRGANVAPAPPTPLANAGPLGLSAFAITTFLLSMVNAGLTKAGGYLGLLTAAAGADTAMAEITNATFGRTAFPINPLS